MEKETTIFHGATVELIKDEGAKARHAYIKVNNHDVLHLIENEKGNFKVYRYDLPYLCMGELMVTFENLKVDDTTSFLTKKDIEL